jgi:cytochrome c-type biogenesis protein CcmF
VLVVMGDEVVRGARARARARGEAAPQAAWRLANRNRRRYGGYLVHAGICLMGIAIAVSATQGTEASASLAPGDSMSLGGYTIAHDRLVVERLASDPRVIETRAELTVSGRLSATMSAALRDYPNSATAIATPGVRTMPGEDLYVTLQAADVGSGAVTLRVFVNPLVAWIWVGGLVVALGAAFAIWPDRRRERAP